MNRRIKDATYEFPPLTAEDIKVLKNYDLKLVSKESDGNCIVEGKLQSLYAYADEWLGYMLHPDYIIYDSCNESKVKDSDYSYEVVKKQLDDPDFDNQYLSEKAYNGYTRGEITWEQLKEIREILKTRTIGDSIKAKDSYAIRRIGKDVYLSKYNDVVSLHSSDIRKYATEQEAIEGINSISSDWQDLWEIVKVQDSVKTKKDSKIKDAGGIGGVYQSNNGELVFVIWYGTGYSAFTQSGDYYKNCSHLSTEGMKDRIFAYQLTKIKDSMKVKDEAIVEFHADKIKDKDKINKLIELGAVKEDFGKWVLLSGRMSIFVKALGISESEIRNYAKEDMSKLVVADSKRFTKQELKDLHKLADAFKVKDTYDIKVGAIFKETRYDAYGTDYLKVIKIDADNKVTFNYIRKEKGTNQYDVIDTGVKRLEHFREYLADRHYKQVNSLYDSKGKDKAKDSLKSYKVNGKVVKANDEFDAIRKYRNAKKSDIDRK